MIMMKPNHIQLQCPPRPRENIYNLSLPDTPVQSKKKTRKQHCSASGENSKQQKTLVLQDAEIGRICKHTRATTGGRLQKSCMSNEIQQQKTWAGNRNVGCKNRRKLSSFHSKQKIWTISPQITLLLSQIHLFRFKYSNHHVCRTTEDLHCPPYIPWSGGNLPYRPYIYMITHIQ